MCKIKFFFVFFFKLDFVQNSGIKNFSAKIEAPKITSGANFMNQGPYSETCSK
jgi:hypothetical protein